MDYPIKVNYEYTHNTYKAKQWLNNLPDVFAADFEIASRYTNKNKAVIKENLDNYKLSFNTEKTLQQQLSSDGLSHPMLTKITHLSIAWSDRDRYVIICDTERIIILV